MSRETGLASSKECALIEHRLQMKMHERQINSLPEIKFEHIIARSGDKRKAFEELSVQVFSARFGSPLQVVRVAGEGGDRGVEAYWNKGQRQTGLQAKYIFTLRNKKGQLDRSLKAALKNFPQMHRYIFVLPFNRTTKQIQQWTGWVKQWNALAKACLGREINIEWCGASNLCALLHKPGGDGLIRYYFGYPSFTDDWLQGNLNAAIQQLDTRYTPDINIETTAADRLFAFAGTAEFQSKYYDAAAELCKIWRYFQSYFPGEPPNEEVSRRFAEVGKFWEMLFGKLGDEKSLPEFAKVGVATEALDEALAPMVRAVGSLDYNDRPNRERWEQGTWTSRHYEASRLQSVLRKFRSFLQQYHYWGKQFILLTGEAGSGKSHLLAAISRLLMSRASPCILLLGETFTTASDPWEQAREHLGWSDTVDCLLQLLEAKAKENRALAFILVDAINESDHRKMWQRLGSKFAARLLPYPSLRLILSCRSDFLNVCLPGSIIESREAGWSRLHHAGFDINMFQAVRAYFDRYHVESEHFPPFLPEFSNPLFLKTLCEVYKGRCLPAGPLALSEVFREHRKLIQREVSKQLDRDETVVAEAIDLLIAEMQKEKSSRVNVAAVKQRINALAPEAEASKSLYAHLRSSGLFVEIGDPTAPEGKVRFAFERFYDFFLADKILSEFTCAEEAKAAFTKDGPFRSFLTDYLIIQENRGLIGAFSLLFPERFGVEFSSLIAHPAEAVMRAFMESLKWRTAESIKADEAERLIWKFGRNFFGGLFYELIELAAIPGHPFNADWMHKFLNSRPMSKRENPWTWAVSTYAAEDERFEANRFLHWSQNVPTDIVSEEQARLAATMLGWFFCCTNVKLRDDATHAAIRILKRHKAATLKFIETFDAVDDPYLRERAYAVASGVSMCASDKDILAALARTVYKRVFETGSPPPHILLRDYALTVMEKAHHWDALPDDIDLNRCKPPYKSKSPRIRITETEMAAKCQEKSYEPLCRSLELTSEGGYKNFGARMEYVVRYFTSVPLRKPPPVGDWRNPSHFDARIAKRFVFQKVRQLGWRPGKFEDGVDLYENEKRPNIEKIRKKYQWIALHEFNAFLADHYHLDHGWSEVSSKYEGAWQTPHRDIDPSGPVEVKDRESGFVPDDCWWCKYPDPISSSELQSNSAWLFNENVDDLRTLFETVNPQTGKRMLALAGSVFWDEKPPYFADRAHPLKDVWIHFRSWLVRSDESAAFIRELKTKHFYGNGIMLAEGHFRGWVGEYPWGSVYAYMADACAGTWSEWLQGIQTNVIATGCHIRERSLLVPSPQVVNLLEARWSGTGLDYFTKSGELVATNPSVREVGPEVILVDASRWVEKLHSEGYVLVWTGISERSLRGDAFRNDFPGSFEFSSVHWLDNGVIKGGITRKVKREPFRQRSANLT
jgi:hypothetical protein